jgi:adenylate kinase
VKNKKKIIILLGPPGVGKGTIANYLKESDSQLKHVSLGSVCREYALEDTEFGCLIKSTIDQGKLVELSLIEMIINKVFKDFLNEKINEKDENEILILDGFPRTIEQASLFFNLFNKYFLIIDFYIILLYADSDILKRRLINRYICSNLQCDKIYSCTIQNMDNYCIKCNSILYQRKDDNINIISNRLLFHYEEEIKIINYFNEKNITFFQMDGNNNIKNLVDNIYEIIYSKNSNTPSVECLNK